MQSSPRRAGFGALTALVALALAAPLAAHHGWSGYQEQEFEITGTVESGVSLAGPHATMRIKSEGKVWDLTLSPPAMTQSSGLKEGVIPVGATIKAHGHRSQDPNRLEVKTEWVSWNGKTFKVYPNRDS